MFIIPLQSNYILSKDVFIKLKEAVVFFSFPCLSFKAAGLLKNTPAIHIFFVFSNNDQYFEIQLELRILLGYFLDILLLNCNTVMLSFRA